MAALKQTAVCVCRDQASHVEKQFFMWSPSKTGNQLYHADIDFDITSVIANTEGWDVGIQLVTSDQPPDAKIYSQLLAQRAGEWSGCNHAIEAAGVGNSATLADICILEGILLQWGSTAADMVVIDAGATSIRGICYVGNLNAETFKGVVAS